jgi:uncharacterized repeat protein (TIGR01451 family)
MRQLAYAGFAYLKIPLINHFPLKGKGEERQLDKLTWAIRVILLLLFWLSSTWLVTAQSPEDNPPLSLSKKTTVDKAVAGDMLTYSLVLTNSGEISLEEVIVSDATPAGTTLFGVSSPPGWTMTTPGQGRTGQVVWQAEEALPPGAEVTLEFIVTINPDSTGPIINNNYSAQFQGWPEPVTGPPVITELVSPTPTWTPPLVETETPTKTPTGAPTKELPVTPATTPAAITTASPDVVLEQAQSPTPMLSPVSSKSADNPSESTGIGTIAWIIAGIVVIAIGLTLFIGRRTRG